MATEYLLEKMHRATIRLPYVIVLRTTSGYMLKMYAGSHVLIKHQAGKKIPKDVIERAAQLAAYYSKRKNETLCPVAVTPKKFVRKRKGDPAGMVVVEKEDTILVEPKP